MVLRYTWQCLLFFLLQPLIECGQSLVADTDEFVSLAVVQHLDPEPVYDWWDPINKLHTIHFNDSQIRYVAEKQHLPNITYFARNEHEVMGAQIFYAFRQDPRRLLAEPVYEFWDETNKRYSYHFLPAWPGETKEKTFRGYCRYGNDLIEHDIRRTKVRAHYANNVTACRGLCQDYRALNNVHQSVSCTAFAWDSSPDTGKQACHLYLGKIHMYDHGNGRPNTTCYLLEADAPPKPLFWAFKEQALKTEQVFAWWDRIDLEHTTHLEPAFDIDGKREYKEFPLFWAYRNWSAKMPQPKLTQIYDFWDDNAKEHTFHSAPSWKTAQGRNETPGRVQFLAYDGPVEDSEAVYHFYDTLNKEHTVHFPPPWKHEVQQDIAFYAFKTRVDDHVVEIHTFWDDANRQHTFHTLPAWDNENPGSWQFFAYAPMDDTIQPVYEFWDDKNKQHTYHFPPVWKHGGVAETQLRPVFSAYTGPTRDGTSPVWDWWDAESKQRQFRFEPVSGHGDGWSLGKKGSVQFYAFPVQNMTVNRPQTLQPVYDNRIGRDNCLSLTPHESVDHGSKPVFMAFIIGAEAKHPHELGTNRSALYTMSYQFHGATSDILDQQAFLTECTTLIGIDGVSCSNVYAGDSGTILVDFTAYKLEDVGKAVRRINDRKALDVKDGPFKAIKQVQFGPHSNFTVTSVKDELHKVKEEGHQKLPEAQEDRGSETTFSSEQAANSKDEHKANGLLNCFNGVLAGCVVGYVLKNSIDSLDYFAKDAGFVYNFKLVIFWHAVLQAVAGIAISIFLFGIACTLVSARLIGVALAGVVYTGVISFFGYTCEEARSTSFGTFRRTPAACYLLLMIVVASYLFLLTYISIRGSTQLVSSEESVRNDFASRWEQAQCSVEGDIDHCSATSFSIACTNGGAFEYLVNTFCDESLRCFGCAAELRQMSAAVDDEQSGTVDSDGLFCRCVGSIETTREKTWWLPCVLFVVYACVVYATAVVFRDTQLRKTSTYKDLRTLATTPGENPGL